MTAARGRLLLTLLTLVVAAPGCAASRADVAVPAPTTTTAAPTTTTTLAPTTTSSTAPPAPLPGIGRGDRGEAVSRLEAKLAEMHYDVGKVDGYYDGVTVQAVTAFQKVTGLPRTGRATPETGDAILRGAQPDPMLAEGGSTRVEVDLKRQVLFLWKNGALERVLPVSTGSGKRYCVDGDCATAVTPGGSFRVTRKWTGLRVSRLGKLYNPLYFNGGIAIHGAPSVPSYPASHGCVRIPMSASLWFFNTVATGTPVYVLGGHRAPVPFGEQAPGEQQTTTTSEVTTSSTSSSTSTTAPAATVPTSTTSTSTTTSTTAPPKKP